MSLLSNRKDIFKIKREEIIKQTEIVFGKHKFARKVFVTVTQHNDANKIIAFEILKRISKGDNRKNKLKKGDIEYRFTYFKNTKKPIESESIPLIPDKDMKRIFKKLRNDKYFKELSIDRKNKRNLTFLTSLLEQV